nr:cytochrome P450 71A1-like [Tanacetum cinerariifolium]
HRGAPPLCLPLPSSHHQAQPTSRPKPWPIIGNFNLIGSLPHRSVHDLSQKYGHIMHFKFGSKRVVVGSSAEMAKIRVEETKSLIKEVHKSSGEIPWISFMDLQGYVKRMKAVSKRFDRFLEHVLTEHEQRRFTEGESFVPKDMVDQLLQIADDPTLNVKLERHGKKDSLRI